MNCPERELNPPEDYGCEGCHSLFHSDTPFEDDEPVLCYECSSLLRL